MPSPHKKFTKTYAENLEGVQKILHIASEACAADRGTPTKGLGCAGEILFTDEQKKEYDAAVASWTKSARKNYEVKLGKYFSVPQDGEQKSLMGYAKAAEKARLLVGLNNSNCKEVKAALDAFYKFGGKPLGSGHDVDELNHLLDSAIAAARSQSVESVPVVSSDSGSVQDSESLPIELLSKFDAVASGETNEPADSATQAGRGYIERPITTYIMVPEEALKNFIKVCNPVFGKQISLSPGDPYREISYANLKCIQYIWNYCQTQLAGSGVMGPMPVSHSGPLLLEGNSRPVNHDAAKPAGSPAVTGDVARKEAKDKASSKRSAQATESRSMIQKIVHIITWPLRAVWGLLMVIFSPIMGLFSSSKSSCGSEGGCCGCHSPVPADDFSPSSPRAGNAHHKSRTGSADLKEGLSVNP